MGNTVINQLELADPNKYYIHVDGKFIEVAGEKVDLFPHAGDFFMHRSHDGWEGRRWKISEGITGGSICAAEPKKNVKAAAMRKLKTRLHGGETIDHRIESLIDGDYKNVSPRYRRKET